MTKKNPRLAVVEADGSQRPVAAMRDLTPITMADCPKWLTADQRARFQHVIETSPAGVIASIDAEVVASYVTQLEQYEIATANLAVEGLTVASHNGILRINPTLKAQQALLDSVLKAGKQLGLTPASRNRVKPNGKMRERQSNPFKTFT